MKFRSSKRRCCLFCGRETESAYQICRECLGENRDIREDRPVEPEDEISRAEEISSEVHNAIDDMLN